MERLVYSMRNEGTVDVSALARSLSFVNPEASTRQDDFEVYSHFTWLMEKKIKGMALRL